MDFEFSTEQEQLRDAIDKWVKKAYTFENRRQIVNESGYSNLMWSEMANLGLCGLYIPSKFDGMDMGPVEVMVAMQALGSGMVLEPIMQSWICSAVLNAFAQEEMKTEWLPKMANGEAKVALAYQEAGSRYKLDYCKTKAVFDGKTWRLTGVKSLVPFGENGTAFIVSAIINSEINLFLVEKSAEAIFYRTYLLQEGSLSCDIELSNTPARLLTEEGQAALELAVDIGNAASCAEAVGVMDKTLTLTIDYLNTRKQFGVSLNSFQALRHRLADMKMQLELSRSMSYYASLKLNDPAPQRRIAMSRAKYQIGRSMRLVGQEGIQMHGGIGMTDEYIMSHYFKKLTQIELTFGDTMHHLGYVSDHMQDTAGVFV